MIYLSDLKNLSFSDKTPVLNGPKSVNAVWDLLQDYDEHKEKCANGMVLLQGFNNDKKEHVEKEIPILYRTDGQYKKRLLAKLYTLDDWYESLPRTQKYVSMLTLTTKQRGVSFFTQYELLRDSWQKVRDLVKHQHPNAEYIAIWEPHKTGFAHMHIVYFGVKFSSDYASKLSRLWTSKYGAGGKDAVRIDTRYTGSLKSARNYVMKYVSKSLTDNGKQNIRNIDDSDLKAHVADEGLHFKIFNAVLWQMSRHDSDFKGIRSFQPSRTLSEVMASRIDKSNTDWLKVYFCYGNEKYLIHETTDDEYSRIRKARNMLERFKYMLKRRAECAWVTEHCKRGSWESFVLA